MRLYEQISRVFYLSNPSRYYLNEGILLENPNQAVKFLKDKDLDPATNPEGKKIINLINGFTRGDGYTNIMTRFYVNDKLPLDDLKKLHEYLKQNKEQTKRLPKPVVNYEKYRELFDDIQNLESMRTLKKLYNELPAYLKQQHQKLSEIEQQKLKELAGRYANLTKEQQDFFIRKIRGYKDIRIFIDNLNNYIYAIENKEDYNSVKQKIEATENAHVAYDNPEQNIVIAHINSFDASKTLGCTTSWCLAKDPSRYREYRRGGNYYFFIWDFSYSAENMNYLVGTAFNYENPSGSNTHGKDNTTLKFGDVVKNKNIDIELLKRYIDGYRENLAKYYKTTTGLLAALSNFNENPDELVEIIRNSEFIRTNGTSDAVNVVSNYYDDGIVELGLTKEQLIDILELGDEFENIQSAANSSYESGYYDTEEANYMIHGINADNLKLINDLANKVGYPKEKIGKFNEDDEINNFLEEYGFDSISEEYVSEYASARDDAEQNAAKEIVDEVPFDIDEGTFKPSEMLEYMHERDIKIDNFDELIEKVIENLPDISWDTISEAGYQNMDLDNLNKTIKDQLERIIYDVENDEDSEHYIKAKGMHVLNAELEKLGFTREIQGDAIAGKEMKHANVFITDKEINQEGDEVYVNLLVKHKPNFYKKTGAPKPKDRKYKIPIDQLKNYIDQLQIPYLDEAKLIHLINEELLLFEFERKF